MIPASVTAASPLREPVLTAPQPDRNTGPVREKADVGLVEKTAETDLAQKNAALAEINEGLKIASVGLRFELDKEADRMIAKVVDVETGEVVRQIPSEEVVRVSKMMDQLKGLLFDQVV